jgi:hypothetical protein
MITPFKKMMILTKRMHLIKALLMMMLLKMHTVPKAKDDFIVNNDM